MYIYIYIKCTSLQITSACSNSQSSNVQVNNVTDLKLRPIIAGPSCLTHRLSHILLRPLTKRVKSHLRDTMDFLNHLPETVPESLLLVSFDVEFLYSNIPHNLGLEAIKFWLQKYPNSIHSRFTND